jgi:hypothetical protein
MAELRMQAADVNQMRIGLRMAMPGLKPSYR